MAHKKELGERKKICWIFHLHKPCPNFSLFLEWKKKDFFSETFSSLYCRCKSQAIYKSQSFIPIRNFQKALSFWNIKSLSSNFKHYSLLEKKERKRERITSFKEHRTAHFKCVSGREKKRRKYFFLYTADGREYVSDCTYKRRKIK